MDENWLILAFVGVAGLAYIIVEWIKHRCFHQWEIVEKYEVSLYFADKPYAIENLMRCKNCGDLKKFRL